MKNNTLGYQWYLATLFIVVGISWWKTKYFPKIMKYVGEHEATTIYY